MSAKEINILADIFEHRLEHSLAHLYLRREFHEFSEHMCKVVDGEDILHVRLGMFSPLSLMPKSSRKLGRDQEQRVAVHSILKRKSFGYCFAFLVQ